MTSLWAMMVYVTFALGGLAVLLLLPRMGRSTRMAGAIIGVAGLGSAMALCAGKFLGGAGGNFIFYLSAVLAVGSAVKVITHEKPVYSALYFVLTVLAITPLLVLQGAEFLAVALVIIYAGAILVTYVFVIMLAQQTVPPAYDRRSREPVIAVLAGFTTMAVIAGQAAVLPEKTMLRGELASGWENGEWRIANSELVSAKDAAPVPAIASPFSTNENANIGSRFISNACPPDDVGYRLIEGFLPVGLKFIDDTVPAPDSSGGDNTLLVGGVMMTEYVVAFELAGVLLLIAMVGAIAMSRKRVATEDMGGEKREPGALGREAQPY